MAIRSCARCGEGANARQSQFPTLEIGSVQYWHEGWDSAAFLVNGEWVFRFPKRRERIPQSEAEVSVLGLLNSQRLPLCIPDPVHVGRPGPLFPCGFMGYRLLRGTQGDRFDEHLLLDDAGRVAGIIDWGDVCLADPALDFAGLYAWLGEKFVRQVLDHYRAAQNSTLMEQIAFRARCAALTSYGWSLQGHGTSPADRLPMVLTAFGIPAF